MPRVSATLRRPSATRPGRRTSRRPDVTQRLEQDAEQPHDFADDPDRDPYSGTESDRVAGSRGTDLDRPRRRAGRSRAPHDEDVAADYDQASSVIGGARAEDDASWRRAGDGVHHGSHRRRRRLAGLRRPGPRHLRLAFATRSERLPSPTATTSGIPGDDDGRAFPAPTSGRPSPTAPSTGRSPAPIRSLFAGGDEGSAFAGGERSAYGDADERPGFAGADERPRSRRCGRAAGVLRCG